MHTNVPPRDRAPPCDHLIAPQPEQGLAWGSAGPQAVGGDASFSRLLGHQRQAQAEHRQSDGLDDDTAELLPLMLSLARLSARAMVQGTAQ